MIEKIEPIPKIPEALRLAALQFFVSKGKLSHARLDQIRSLSSRVKLSGFGIGSAAQPSHRVQGIPNSLWQAKRRYEGPGIP